VRGGGKKASSITQKGKYSPILPNYGFHDLAGRKKKEGRRGQRSLIYPETYSVPFSTFEGEKVGLCRGGGKGEELFLLSLRKQPLMPTTTIKAFISGKRREKKGKIYTCINEKFTAIRGKCTYQISSQEVEKRSILLDLLIKTPRSHRGGG